MYIESSGHGNGEEEFRHLCGSRSAMNSGLGRSRSLEPATRPQARLIGRESEVCRTAFSISGYRFRVM